MSKYKIYAEKLYTEIRKVYTSYLEAKEKVDYLNDRLHTAEVANSPRLRYIAQASLEEATEAFNAEKIKLSKTEDISQAIRGELVAQINRDNAVNSADIDNATMEIFRSGMRLTPDDFIRLMESANNRTMRRIIAGKITDYLQGNSGIEMNKARELRLLANAVPTETVPVWFDEMCDYVHRAVRNATLVNEWDNWAKQAIENV